MLIRERRSRDQTEVAEKQDSTSGVVAAALYRCRPMIGRQSIRHSQPDTQASSLASLVTLTIPFTRLTALGMDSLSHMMNECPSSRKHDGLSRKLQLINPAVKCNEKP